MERSFEDKRIDICGVRSVLRISLRAFRSRSGEARLPIYVYSDDDRSDAFFIVTYCLSPREGVMLLSWVGERTERMEREIERALREERVETLVPRLLDREFDIEDMPFAREVLGDESPCL